MSDDNVVVPFPQDHENVRNLDRILDYVGVCIRDGRNVKDVMTLSSDDVNLVVSALPDNYDIFRYEHEQDDVVFNDDLFAHFLAMEDPLSTPTILTMAAYVVQLHGRKYDTERFGVCQAGAYNRFSYYYRANDDSTVAVDIELK